jgi:hypothetical protein
MNKEYSIYLENLKGRRYDEVLKEPIFSESFHQHDNPDVLKYVLESMHEIEPGYSYKLFSAIRRTQDLITQQLKMRDIVVDARYQGPHSTDTHIELYGDLEMMIILKSFDRKPSRSIEALATEITDILTKAEAYNKIDYSEKNRINIQTSKPTCNVSILPAIWVESSLYRQSTLEINRGICEFNFSKKTRRMYLPFLNIARINSRDRKLGGGLKAIARLLVSLKQDAEEPISLTHDEILGIIYNIPIKELAIPSNQILSVLPNVSLHLNRLINDNEHREKLLSPSKKEYVFGKKNKMVVIQQLKVELDEVIDDLKDGLKTVHKTLMSPMDY